MRLERTETDLVGNWILDQDRVVRDVTDNRIGQLIEGYLEKIAVSPASGGWEILYRDPSDGRYWELTYPKGEMHGGGPRRLTVLTAQAAEVKYRLTSP